MLAIASLSLVIPKQFPAISSVSKLSQLTMKTKPMQQGLADSQTSKAKKALIKNIFEMFALLSIFMCASCISPYSSQQYEYGTKLDASKVSQIKKGVTTRVEVEALLGPPATVSMYGADGKRMMSYSYMSTSSEGSGTINMFYPAGSQIDARARTRMQTLQVVLDKSGIVEDYEFNDGTTNTKSSGDLLNRTTTSTSTATPPTTETKP